MSLMYYSPYRPCSRRLLWPGYKIGTNGNLLLKVTDEYPVMYEACAFMQSHGGASWTAKFYRLDNSNRKLDVIDVADVEVVACDARVATWSLHGLDKAPKPSKPRGHFEDALDSLQARTDDLNSEDEDPPDSGRSNSGGGPNASDADLPDCDSSVVHSSDESGCGDGGDGGEVVPPPPENPASDNTDSDENALERISERAFQLDFATPFGTLTRYASGIIVATCFVDEHAPRCRKTKSSRFGPLHGRPVGFLYAWLKAGHSPTYVTRYDHVHKCECSAADFRHARREFYELPGGKAFARAVERAKPVGHADSDEVSE